MQGSYVVMVARRERHPPVDVRPSVAATLLVRLIGALARYHVEQHLRRPGVIHARDYRMPHLNPSPDEMYTLDTHTHHTQHSSRLPGAITEETEMK